MANRSRRPLQFIFEPILEELEQVKSKLLELAVGGGATLTNPLSHITTTSGKKMRPAITILAAKLGPGPTDLSVIMATAIELIHIATLIHDDTVDESTIRRGQATVSTLWGRDVAVLVGDYAFAASATFVCDTKNIRVIRRFSETIMELSSGELEELFSAYNWNLSMDEYKNRIYKKTASLFFTAAESGAILSEADESQIRALGQFGYNIGMAFQIVDDILDFHGTEQEVGKPVGNDLLHGTITLPAILLLEKYPEGNPIKELSHGADQNTKVQEAVAMIQNSSIIQDAYNIAWEYHKKALAALDELPKSRGQQSLEALADYIIERRV